jgi:putative addiction module CopG family antidote
MAFALAKEQKRFISRMVRRGSFNNQSEVVREALRRMEDGESDYLTPPLLTAAQVKGIYRRKGKEEDHEKSFGRAVFAAVRRAVRRGARP